MLKIIRTASLGVLALFLFCACTGTKSDIPTEAPIIATSLPTQSPSATPTPTPTPVPPSPTPEFTATPPLPLEFIPFPAQVALQGEPFNPVNAFQYLVEPGIPAAEMSWKTGNGEHITASIMDGMLSAAVAQPDWMGTETLQVEACDPIGRCAAQEISYTVLDASAYGNVKVVYVGNSGFLISAGDKKVLIDAFQDGLETGYVLPGYVQSALLSASPPFDAVDMILVTHNHPDHFSRRMVKQYMDLNPEVVLVSTTQVVEQLADFGERAIAVDPASGSPVSLEANGIEVEAFYLSHGAPTTGSETFNNAYVVSMNGIKLFHTGDTNAFRDVSQFGLDEEQLDLAFIVHMFMFNNSYTKVIENDIHADYLFPIHYQYTAIEFIPAQVLFNYPEAVVFNLEMETWVMPKSSK